MTADATRQPRRPGRPPKAEAGDTKAALLAAALGLFARNGFAGTSIRAIAREVGLSESVLYAHFDSKRAIFDAVLTEYGPHGAIGALEGVDPDLIDTDPAAVVRRVVTGIMTRWDTAQARALISLMSQDGLVHEGTLAGAITDALIRFGALIERWIAAGHIDAALGDPTDIAYALISPIAQARILWLHADATPAERKSARDRVARHTEFFIRAVLQTGAVSPATIDSPQS